MVSDVTILDEVVCTRDRDRLSDVPVRGSETQACRRGGALGRIHTSDRDTHVRRRLALQHNVERRNATRFGRDQPTDRTHGDATAIIVRGGHRDIAGVGAGVVGIRTDRRASDDRVSHVAIVDGIVHAGDGDRASDIPVDGSERHTRRSDGAFADVVARKRDCHVRGRLAAEHDGERGRAAGFRGDQAGERRDGDVRGVVIRVRDRDIGGIEAGIVRVRTGRRVEHDLIRDVAILNGFIDTRDRDRLVDVPVR